MNRVPSTRQGGAASNTKAAQPSAETLTFFQALADDASTLALLHERELDAEVIADLRRLNFPYNLALLPLGQTESAYQFMREALAQLPPSLDAATLDQLACDYAAIYLNGSLNVSPSESVWVSDDHLACQDAMFELRERYAAIGLRSPDWRKRPDDHLCYQLHYLARRLAMLEQAPPTLGLEELATFLDDHLLRWLADFAGKVAQRCDTPLYAALNLLTSAWVEQLREHMMQALGTPRPTQEQVALRRRKPVEAVPMVFVPGTGPTL